MTISNVLSLSLITLLVLATKPADPLGNTIKQLNALDLKSATEVAAQPFSEENYAKLASSVQSIVSVLKELPFQHIKAKLSILSSGLKDHREFYLNKNVIRQREHLATRSLQAAVTTSDLSSAVATLRNEIYGNITGLNATLRSVINGVAVSILTNVSAVNAQVASQINGINTQITLLNNSLVNRISTLNNSLINQINVNISQVLTTLTSTRVTLESYIRGNTTAEAAARIANDNIVQGYVVANVTGLEAEVDAADAALETEIEEVKEDLSDLSTEVTTLSVYQGEQDTAITAAQNSADAAQDSADTANAGVAAANDRIDGVEIAIDALNAEQSTQNDAIDALEAEQSTQNDAIDALEAEQSTQNDAIDALEAEQSTQNDAITATNDRIDDVVDDVDTLELSDASQSTSISTLTTDVTTLTGQVGPIQDSLNTANSNIAALQSTVESQGDTLTSLSTVSAELTSYIDTQINTVNANLETNFNNIYTYLNEVVYGQDSTNPDAQYKLSRNTVSFADGFPNPADATQLIIYVPYSVSFTANPDVAVSLVDTTGSGALPPFSVAVQEVNSSYVIVVVSKSTGTVSSADPYAVTVLAFGI